MSGATAAAARMNDGAMTDALMAGAPLERERYDDFDTIDREDRPKSRIKTACEVMDARAPDAIVDGIAYPGRTTVLVSESGTGKTFVNLDMAATIADDLGSWHGRRVRNGSVVYHPFEADDFGKRLRALRDHHGCRLEHFYVIEPTGPISPQMTRDGEVPSIAERATRADLEELAARLESEGKPPIVANYFDTVRASLTGNEDNSQDVAAYLRSAKRINAVTPQAALILSHHAGWQDGETPRKRERGSSAWRGNVDVTLYLEAGEYDEQRGERRLTLKTLKVRDEETGPPIYLVRRRVELLEMGPDGGPKTSCVIEPDRRTREDRQAAAAAAIEAECQAIDLKTLQAIHERPELATSQDRIRMMLGIRKTVVSESLSRLLTSGLVSPGIRNQPYRITERGRTHLEKLT